ncbi:hypothetical protein ACVII1_000201 [Bradyrhizobium elkanii]|jgi:hypothetical protein|uniref:HTH luxR-type domain-containing protein n=2 Tax=Nitrobacteraceae TaxID=41294 RepID=A0ABV4EQJ0_BRAEL
MVEVSQRGRAYSETAWTLLRAAQTMTDPTIAGQLKTLADDYERRAEKAASHVDAAKAFARSAASVEHPMACMTGGAASNMSLEFCTIEALNLRPGSKELEAFNVERVRGYLECNLGCTKKEVIRALGLNPRTVAKAIKIIRANAHGSDGTLQP